MDKAIQPIVLKMGDLDPFSAYLDFFTNFNIRVTSYPWQEMNTNSFNHDNYITP